MGLTMGGGPLSGEAPAEVNYELHGPPHQLLLQPFPRRVRARFGDEVVLDTRRGSLLHETGILPVLYVPRADVAEDLLRPSDHTTHCPFKGDAAYWSIHAGGRVATDAVWGYPQPKEAAPWLADLVACYWDRVDAWFDEDEEVHGHLRDPYHRVDVRRSSTHVRVVVAGEVLAESWRPLVLSETGLPNRWYLPVHDVRLDRLTSSTTRTICPYKGTASYWSMIGGPDDVAWSYVVPLEDATKTAGHLSFLGGEVVTEVEGQAQPT